MGCLDVAICGDLVDPGRVNIFERGESQADAETFHSSGSDTEQHPAMLTVSVQEYDIADVRPVFGKGCGVNLQHGATLERWSAPRCGHNGKSHHERTGESMKLMTTTQVSVDGVMQGCGGPDEDRRGGFDCGGWAMGLFDEGVMRFLNEVYQRAEPFLFGRRTYEPFAGYDGVRDDLENPIVGALNTRPKYATSTTLTDPRWTDTTVLSGDVAAAVRERTAKPGASCRCTTAAP